MERRLQRAADMLALSEGASVFGFPMNPTILGGEYSLLEQCGGYAADPNELRMPVRQ